MVVQHSAGGFPVTPDCYLGWTQASEWVGQNFDSIFMDKITQHGNETSPGTYLVDSSAISSSDLLVHCGTAEEVLSTALEEAFLEVEEQWMKIAMKNKECSG